jgi:hypothetical protein
MPGPAPQAARPGDVALENARCEGCHTEVAREWRASMHAQASVDPVYQRALAIEPLPFCRGCHAPEADPRRDAPPGLARLGVGCVTCHATGDGVRGPVLAAAPPAVAPPHPVLISAAFGTAAACASCHEFDFPIHAPGRRPDRMQSTVSEHATGPYAADSCSSCHMPWAPGPRRHRSHGFAAARDLPTLRAALTVTAARTSPSRVTITLAPGQVGHAIPTGDLFRRLVVSAEAVGDDWTVVSEASRALHRHFAFGPAAEGHVVRELVGDDRVGVGPSRPVDLDFGDAARGLAVAWRVEYQRVEHPLGADESDVVVADSVVVAEGVIPSMEGQP